MTLFRPFDTILILLVLVATVLAVYFFRGVTGNKAEIHFGSQKIASFDLNKAERIKEIDSRIGKFRIRMGNGSIQVLSSPCNQKICILQGAISQTHEHIICLPAQMYISIVDSDHSENLFDKIDAISY